MSGRQWVESLFTQVSGLLLLSISFFRRMFIKTFLIARFRHVERHYGFSDDALYAFTFPVSKHDILLRSNSFEHYTYWPSTLSDRVLHGLCT